MAQTIQLFFIWQHAQKWPEFYDLVLVMVGADSKLLNSGRPAHDEF